MYQRLDPLQALPLWRGLTYVLLPSLLAFVFMDMIWIGAVASGFYQQQLASILKADVDPVAGLLAWLCIVGASYVFVLPRALESGSAGGRALQGAMMGVALYGTCDLTNCALIRDWSWPLALLDLCWGTTACTALALIQAALYEWQQGRGGR